jgi:ribonucleotide reductase alpha subunit
MKWLDDDYIMDTWNKKYRNVVQVDENTVNSETLQQWFNRVCNGDEELIKRMEDMKFLFGGRILANRGLVTKDHKVTLSNCYVLPPVEDNIHSIMKTAEELAVIFSRGGGVGIDISKLRYKGAPVRNSAETTTGACSFMQLYDVVTSIIGQKGRRGALIITMDCDHPDIHDFIDIKKDLNMINNANISVKVSDRFMKYAVEKPGKSYSVRCKITDEITGAVWHEHVIDVTPSEILQHIAENNWRMAEPGIIFKDAIEDYNFIEKNPCINITGVNPCVTGDTLIQTVEGNIQIKDLVGQTPHVYCMDDEGNLAIQQATKVWKTRKNARLVKVDFLRGSIICTPYHKIYTRNRGWVFAQDLKPKDKLNGLCRRMKDEIHCAVKLSSQKNFTSEHRFILGHFEDITGMDVHHKDDNPLNNVLSNLEAIPHHEHSKISNLGHEDWNTRDEEGKFITTKSDFVPRESLTVNQRNKGLNFIVQKVEVLDYTEDVYDMEVPKYHNFIANDIVIHNCGELPLPNYGSCNLGNINLSAYVKNPFTANAEFDFVALTQDVPIYVKALNDVLLEGKDYHPIQEQRDAITRYRQIGLGVTGLADMLIKMRVLYGSEEACKLIAKVYSCIINQAVISSVDYAVLNSYASYEGFDVDDFCNCEFAKNTLTRETKEYVKRHGVVFNSQFLTIPPTGSVSIVLGNCSSGVEPNFDWQYNRKIESIYDEPRKVLVTAGIIKEYAEYLGMSVDKVLEVGLPDYFVTATEGVTYRGRVNIQSACQDYIDGAISGTVNLPNDATVEQIVNLYKEAWLQGLKGITVYRVGSEREGILTKIEKTPVVLDENNKAPVILKRGDKKAIAPDTIYYKEEVKIGCGELNLFIGYSPSEKALQDFWVKRKGTGGCERNIESTVISMSLLQRVGGSFEMLEESFKGIGSCNSFVHARSKGAKLSKGSNCGQAIFNTLYDFVKRMALQYVETDENRHTLNYAFTESLPAVFGNPCPVCGKPLHRQGGCYTCDECGYSKCD